MKKTQFIKKEAAEILGIRPSQIQYYTDQGVIIPEISAPKGKGTRRVYSVRNLIEILIAKRAVAHGISIGGAAEIILGLRAFDESVSQPIGDGSREMIRKAYWDVENWADGQSVFLVYRQFYSATGHIEIFYASENNPDEDVFKIEISHDIKSMHVINLTDIVDCLKSI